MARPGKIKLVNGDEVQIQSMTDAEIYATFTYNILKKFASESDVGSLSIQSDSTGNIGYLVDTYERNDVGTHGRTQETRSTNIGFTQIGGSVPETFSRPAVGLNDITDAELDQYIITPALNELTNGGIGSYALSDISNYPSLPYASEDGRTYVQRGSFNQLNHQSDGTINTYRLWQVVNKTVLDYQTNLVEAFARYNIDTTSSEISYKTLSEEQIGYLVQRLRNRITSTGIGTYQFAGNAPTTGTWASVGSASDTRYDVQSRSYSGTYSGTYARNFVRYRTGYYTGSYVRYYGGRNYGTFRGTYTRGFTGYYRGYFRGYYTGSYSSPTVLSTILTIGTKQLWVRRS